MDAALRQAKQEVRAWIRTNWTDQDVAEVYARQREAERPTRYSAILRAEMRRRERLREAKEFIADVFAPVEHVAC